MSPTTKLRHDTDDLIASGEATIGDVYEKFGRPGVGRLARNCRQECAAVPGFNPPHNGAVSDGTERELQIDELLNLPRQTKIRFIKEMKHDATYAGARDAPAHTVWKFDCNAEQCRCLRDDRAKFR